MRKNHKNDKQVEFWDFYFIILDDDDEYFPYHEQDDNLSFASTPRPNIKPYFDTTSQCSFQPRLSTGGRSHTTIEQCSNLPSVDEGKIDESQKKNKIDPASTTESTESNILTEPSFETSDETTKPQKRIKRYFFKKDYGFMLFYLDLKKVLNLEMKMV